MGLYKIQPLPRGELGLITALHICPQSYQPIPTSDHQERKGETSLLLLLCVGCRSDGAIQESR